MGININIPQIQALRCEVEKVFGKISSHSCLHKLSEDIELKCKEHISVSTLERLWNYSTRNATNISVRILDIVSSYAGADCWEDFCNRLQKESNRESELFENKETINCDTLKEGTRIKIGWLPNRICEVEYIGNYRFVATHTVNSSIKPGDSFRCLQIEQGRELYMDCFTLQGEDMNNSTSHYVVGQTNGITIIEIIPPSDKKS